MLNFDYSKNINEILFTEDENQKLTPLFKEVRGIFPDATDEELRKYTTILSAPYFSDLKNLTGEESLTKAMASAEKLKKDLEDIFKDSLSLDAVVDACSLGFTTDMAKRAIDSPVNRDGKEWLRTYIRFKELEKKYKLDAQKNITYLGKDLNNLAKTFRHIITPDFVWEGVPYDLSTKPSKNKQKGEIKEVVKSKDLRAIFKNLSKSPNAPKNPASDLEDETSENETSEEETPKDKYPIDVPVQTRVSDPKKDDLGRIADIVVISAKNRVEEGYANLINSLMTNGIDVLSANGDEVKVVLCIDNDSTDGYFNADSVSLLYQGKMLELDPSDNYLPDDYHNWSDEEQEEYLTRSYSSSEYDKDKKRPLKSTIDVQTGAPSGEFVSGLDTVEKEPEVELVDKETAKDIVLLDRNTMIKYVKEVKSAENSYTNSLGSLQELRDYMRSNYIDTQDKVYTDKNLHALLVSLNQFLDFDLALTEIGNQKVNTIDILMNLIPKIYVTTRIFIVGKTKEDNREVYINLLPSQSNKLTAETVESTFYGKNLANKQDYVRGKNAEDRTYENPVPYFKSAELEIPGGINITNLMVVENLFFPYPDSGVETEFQIITENTKKGE